MKKENFFYKETALFKLSVGICEVLEKDCCHFGFWKNGKPNLCGLLNHLISELSLYRDDLHEKFLRNYNGNAELVREVENGIYQVYLRSFDLNDDAAFSVPFRVNSAHRPYFESIYEEKLQKYNMDFTNYVRTLLGEYAIKPYYQRELYFYYDFLKKIERAVRRQNICRYIDGKTSVRFIPLALEPFFFAQSGNCLLGVDLLDRTPVILPWRDANRMRVSEEVASVRMEEYTAVSEAWKSFLEKGRQNDVRE